MADAEKRVCKNCKGAFVIEPEDFNFYKKINVPPPTWCPGCRMKRRVYFRNLRSLYKRQCGLCKKPIITMYHEDDPAPVYCYTCWHGDSWDPYDYGEDIDWSKPFLAQWFELFKKVPRFNMWQMPPLQNCDYTNYSIDNKNCYLSYSVTGCEDVRYSENIDGSKNCIDNLYLTDSENCYENVDCIKNYNSRYMMQSRECIDSWFLFDCANCQNCFMSANLRNKQYVFRGEQLSKADYAKKLKEIGTDRYPSLEELKKEFRALLSTQAIHKYADIINSKGATGNHILNSKLIGGSYRIKDAEEIKYSMRVLDHSKDSQDVYGLGSGELTYDCVAVSYGTYHCAFSMLSNTYMRDSEYVAFCISSSNLFGCIGIKKGEYSILNKKYAKEEYETLREKLIKHMNDMPYIDSKGRVYTYGEFFPIEFSPFFYNETIAFDLYPTSKTEAQKEGFAWMEKRQRLQSPTLSARDMPEEIGETAKDITNQAIECMHAGDCEEQCTGVFRILPDDVEFYKRFALPLPRLCPNCRHYERLALREPVQLWHRVCMCNKINHSHASKCQNEFETPYAPERPEIVYCEACYQREIL